MDLSVLGERSIILDCDVIQADGGTRVASITGAWVALALAVKQMLKFKTLSKTPLTGAVAAISVGLLNGEAILDLCYEEDSRAEVDANVVMTEAGQFVEFQAHGGTQEFDDAQMGRMTGLAKTAIAELIAMQRAVDEYAAWESTAPPAIRGSCASFSLPANCSALTSSRWPV